VFIVVSVVAGLVGCSAPDAPNGPATDPQKRAVPSNIETAMEEYRMAEYLEFVKRYALLLTAHEFYAQVVLE
jgi:hypothetical protein